MLTTNEYAKTEGVVILSRQQRRALERATAKGPAPTNREHLPLVVRHEDLMYAAWKKVTEQLTGYGNELSEDHSKALAVIVGRFTHLANGHKTGRYGYGLPCGGGKSESVVAWCWANWKLNTGFTVAVSASRVEDLCELKRKMIDLGVPEDLIGLIHSYGDKASLPPTKDNDERPIVLLTHNKVRGTKDADTFFLYRGKPRDLLIYDESLMISDSRAISLHDLATARSDLSDRYEYSKVKDAEHAGAAIKFVNGCLKAMNTELKRQRRLKRKQVEAKLIKLPEPSDKVREYLKALRSAKGPRARLAELPAFTGIAIRVAASNNGGAYLTYDLMVPASLENVAVLDASFNLRDLSTIGGKVEKDPAFNGKIKRYENVAVRQMAHASGRRATEEHYMLPEENRDLSKEVFEVVKDIPADEAVTIWSFKPKRTIKFTKGGMGLRDVDILDTLRKDLEGLGVDTAATIAVLNPRTSKVEQKPRFVWATWGQETGTNDWVYCENTIILGVLQQDEHQVAAQIVGEQRDLMADTTSVRGVLASEAAHVVYQALSRGASRNTIAGEAAPANVWLVHWDTSLEDRLKPEMPGVVWDDWEPKHVTGIAAVTSRKVAREIVKYLEALPDEVRKVSSRSLKEALGLQGMAQDAFQYARDLTRRDLEIEGVWSFEGRSWVRK